ncbi:MAG TPA: hypothetical protein VLK37_06955 [Solirubrobacterales bacterium]|nr:hypothetical protein [Solirubrobacterales bacterium]
MRAFAKAASAPSTHRENATFSLGVFAAMLVCAAAFLGIGASAAGAATVGQSYAYTNDIGTPDAGAVTSVFTNVVAVSNDDGNVFLIRQGNPVQGQDPAVDVLDPATGASLSRPLTGNFLPAGVAVSADGTEFFITDSFGGPTIQKWVRTSASPLTYEQASWSPSEPLQGPQGIAVDPSTGDLVVSDGNRIKRLDAATGDLLSSFDGSSNPAGAFSGPRSIAVGPDSDIYVVDDPGKVGRYAADGTFTGSFDVGNPTVVATGVAVNPQNGDVAVELPPGYGTTDAVIRIYSAATDLKDVIRVQPTLVESDSSNQINNRGLAFSPDGSKLYVGLKNGSVHVYSRGTQPGLDAPVVSNITPTGATVSATLATGEEPTTARIEYCLASDPCAENLTSEGSSPWHRASDPGDEHLTGEPERIEDELANLVPNAHYLLRAYAINENSQVEKRSGTTQLSTAIPPPLVTTGAATDVSDTSAQLVGSVDNTFGDQTTFHFEYGLTTAYGTRLPAGTDGIAGNLRTPRTVTRLAQGLQPGTTYHYRLVATNSAGTTSGADQTFTTLNVDEVAPRRGYEQVTPANKQGLAVLANWGFQASQDGSAFEFGGTSPSADASSAAVVSRYVSRRGANDWIGAQPLDPPFLPARALVNSATLALSDDFEHALVVSQIALTPDATEGAANIYVRDLVTDAYRFIGSSTEDGAFNGLTGILRLDSFIAGAPDFSWVVMIVQARFLPEAPQTAMYKWTSADGLSLLSRMPDNSVPSANLSLRTPNRMVSADGDSAAFGLREGNEGVYRRSGEQTEAISLSQAAGGPAGVQPAVLDGIDREGRYVVLHTASKLADDDQDGGTSEYRYDSQTGEMAYLGPQDGVNGGTADTLGISDDGKTVYFDSNGERVVWREGQPVDVVYPSPGRGGPREMSPNGRYLEFVGTGETIHLYDAETGEETCISCTAAAPAAAGHLPLPDNNISNRLPQSITDDGHAYFDTPVPLVSADHNATIDVYEYFQGRLTLISPGARGFDAMLADISSDGSDVFFTTAEGLVSQDTDQNYDVYDARIGGGLAAQNPPPPTVPCAGDACQGSVSPPPPATTPGSSGLKESGNANPRQTHCGKNTRKVSRHGKTRCVKKKPHRNKKRHAKHNRGTGR